MQEVQEERGGGRRLSCCTSLPTQVITEAFVSSKSLSMGDSWYQDPSSGLRLERVKENRKGLNLMEVHGLCKSGWTWTGVLPGPVQRGILVMLDS